MKKNDIKKYFQTKPIQIQTNEARLNTSIECIFENPYSDESCDEDFRNETPSMNLLSFYALQKEKNSEMSTMKLHSFNSDLNDYSRRMNEEEPTQSQQNPIEITSNEKNFSSVLKDVKLDNFIAKRSLNSANSLNFSIAKNQLDSINQKRIKTGNLDFFVSKKRGLNQARMSTKKL